MAALRRLLGSQRLLGLPVRAVSSGQTTDATVSTRIPPASRFPDVVEWHPVEKKDEKSAFTKSHRIIIGKNLLNLENHLQTILSAVYNLNISGR